MRVSANHSTSSTSEPFRRFFTSLAIILIMATGYALRVGYCTWPQEQVRYGLGPMGDSILYHRLGYNLYAGNGYSSGSWEESFGSQHQGRAETYRPCVTRAPLYPAFIALTYRLCGDRHATQSVETWHVNWDRLRIAQCVVDTATVLTVFAIARLLFPASRVAAILAAALYMLSFHHIYFTREILSETLGTFVLSLAVLASLAALRWKSAAAGVVAGIVFGAVALCRQEFILCCVCAAPAMLLLAGPPWRRAGRIAVALGLGVTVTIAPWSLRNYLVSGQPVLIAHGMIGYSLFIGSWEGREGWLGWGGWPPDAFANADEALQARLHYNELIAAYNEGLSGSADHDLFFRNLAMRNIRQAPMRCIGSWIVNAPRLWHLYQFPMYARPEASGVWFVLQAGLAALGLSAIPRADRRYALLIIMVTAYIAAIFLPLHIEPRYSLAVRPSLIALAGVGMWKLLGWFGLFRVHE